LSSYVRRARLATFCISVLVATLLAGIGAGPVAAANKVMFFAVLGDCQFSGSAAGAYKVVKITWWDQDRELKSQQTLRSNAAGEFDTRCEPDEIIESGDILQAQIGTVARAFDVPLLTVYADRDTDAVHGHAGLAGIVDLAIVVDAWHGGFTAAGMTEHTAYPHLSNTTYTVAPTDWDVAPDIKGWDDVYAIWYGERGTFVRGMQAEGIRVWVRQAFIDVVGNRGQVVNVQLNQTEGGAWKGEAHAGLGISGEWFGGFVDECCDLIKTKPGNEVVADFASDAHFVIPAITADINKSTDRVTADCGLGAGYGIAIEAHRRDFSASSIRRGTTVSGSTLANFTQTPTFDIKSGDKVDVHCKLPTGDLIVRTLTVP
jgi:hypothetical protein